MTTSKIKLIALSFGIFCLSAEVALANGKDGFLKRAFKNLHEKRVERRAKHQEVRENLQSKISSPRNEPAPKEQTVPSVNVPVNSGSDRLLDVQDTQCAAVPSNIRNIISQQMLARKGSVEDSVLAHQSAKLMGLLFLRSNYNSAQGLVNVWSRENATKKVTHSQGYSSSTLQGKLPVSRYSQVQHISTSAAAANPVQGYGLGGMTVDRFVIGGHGEANFKMLQRAAKMPAAESWEACGAEDIFPESEKDEWLKKYAYTAPVVGAFTTTRGSLSKALTATDGGGDTLSKAVGAILALCPTLNLAVTAHEINAGYKKALYFGGHGENSDWTKGKEVCFNELLAALKTPRETSEEAKPLKRVAKVVGAPFKLLGNGLGRLFSKKDRDSGSSPAPETPRSAEPVAITKPVSSPSKPADPSSFKLSPYASSGIDETKVALIQSDLAKLDQIEALVESDAYYNQMKDMDEAQQAAELERLQTQYSQVERDLSSHAQGIDFNIHVTAKKEISKAQERLREVAEGFQEMRKSQD
ncbi:hypothetical protein GW915_11125 [bacterium]|nr:hypothetical protein [bacterium]